MKPGDILYQVLHEDDGKPTMEEWHIRTIRGGKITAIWKLPHTWGKRSKKHGDFGWLDPIPAWCRQTWRVGSKPIGLSTTRRQAIRTALQYAEKYPQDHDTPEQRDRFIAGLKRMKP
jgi:hypothetical protein